MAERPRRSTAERPAATPEPTRLRVQSGRDFWRSAAASTLRVLVAVTAFGLLYAYAPLGQQLHGSVLAELVLSLMAFVIVTLWEFRNVARSRYPEIRALEAVGIIIPFILLSFSTVYYVMAHEVEASFGTHLSRLDALYFTVTTFATVGFGDIAAKSEAARTVVTLQMVIDLILIGFIAKALLTTARRRRDTLTKADTSARENE
jgi:voltage-gated potassium channel